MFKWASVAGGVVSLLSYIAKGFSSLFSWLRERSLLKQGMKEQQHEDLKATVEVLTKVNEARKEASDSAGTIPESDSLPDDGFRRD